MIDEESPAEISSTEAPSFCACFTDEFMNTVHLEPSSTGAFANKPSLANSAMSYPIAPAKV